MTISANTNINQHFKQLFQDTLPESVHLPELSLERLSQQTEIIVPEPGELFWNSQSSSSGIYLILEGKARLIDEGNNLLVSLDRGKVFGQISLFSDVELQPHAARASWGLKLGYLSQKSLDDHLLSEPGLKNHLYSQALLWDLLLCNGIRGDREMLQELLPVLPNLKRRFLGEGELPDEILDSGLLLLRQGMIFHSSGLKLTPGNKYRPDSLPKDGVWSIHKAIELYTLSSEIQSQSAMSSIPDPPTKNHLELVTSEFGARLKKSIADLPPSSSSSQDRLPKLYFPAPQTKVSHWWQQLTRRYPFLKQQSSSDCGVACMVMIGKYWGKNFSIAELRSVANVDRSGASIKGLIVAAEHLGFAPRPVKVDLPTLAKQKLPAIVHWRGNHYIVVYHVTKKKVIVSDDQSWSSPSNPPRIY